MDDRARSMLRNEPLPANKYTHGQHRDTAFLTLKINVQRSTNTNTYKVHTCIGFRRRRGFRCNGGATLVAFVVLLAS